MGAVTVGGAIEVVPVLRLPKHGHSEKFVCGASEPHAGACMVACSPRFF